MHDDLAKRRLHELLRSPAGCALLIMMEAANMTPAEALEPDTALHLVASAVGELNPWSGTHDEMIERLLTDGQKHCDLAYAILREPGIEQWWAPLDRDQQVWMQPMADAAFPSEDTFPTLDRTPSSWERYAQKPGDRIATSTWIGAWTSQLATCTSGITDWILDYPARRKLVHVSPEARVYEILSAEDWHRMVVNYGTQSDPGMTFHPDTHDTPWGANDGLVPDWHAIARDWDGVHVTLWAFLTGTQVRITSDAGWTGMWSGEGEETTWLRWTFDSVEDMPPVEPIPQGRRYPLSFQIPDPYSVRLRIREG